MIFLKRNAPPEYGKSGLYTMLNFKSQHFLLPLPSQVSKLEVCRKVLCYFGRTWLISSSIALELTHWTGLIGFQPFFLPKHTFLWNPIISYLKIRSVWSRKRGTNRLSEFQKKSLSNRIWYPCQQGVRAWNFNLCDHFSTSKKLTII